MNRTKHDRARLVAALWKLKQEIGRRSLPEVPFVHLNLLLRQPEYRADIVNRALGSGDEVLVTLAAQIGQMDPGGPLLVDPRDQQWLQERDKQLAAALEDEIERASRSGRGYRLGFIASAIALLVLTAGYAYWQMGGSGVIDVSGTLSDETTWSAGRVYRLQDIVTIAPGVLLRIEPGVTIEGLPGSALLVTRGAQLHAKGTAAQPIVFTSAQEIGKRQPGDWGGVVLLGDAPVNVGQGSIEGFPAGDPRALYGGSSPGGSCGVLEYVRIEFAGYEALADNELNGLTLGGCGSGTIVRYLQVHRSLDDGVEIFGGTVNLEHVLITQARDDGLDFDQGWTGRLQFLIVQQTETGDNAIEGDNNPGDHNALPRSAPVIYNATLIGSRRGAQRALVLRTGAAGEFANFLVAGHAVEFADLRDPATVTQVQIGALSLQAMILHEIGMNGTTWFTDETGADDDGGFSEATLLARPGAEISTINHPRLPGNRYNARAPDFTPLPGKVLEAGLRPPQGRFQDETATWLGAVRPGDEAPWYIGWSVFEVN